MSIAGFENLTSVDYQLASARARQFERERDEALAELDDRARKDIDETRRLLYAALAAGQTTKYTLVGTLVNALTHHSGLVDDPYEALSRLVALVEADAEDGPGARLWARDVLARLQEPAGSP